MLTFAFMRALLLHTKNHKSTPYVSRIRSNLTVLFRTEPFLIFTGEIKMEYNLAELREQIDLADKEIAKNFEKRMQAVSAVAAYKKDTGIPVEDREREKAIIEKNLRYIENSEITGYYSELAEKMIELSKKYQFRLNSGMKIAYNGTEGAFAHIASQSIFPGTELISNDSFEETYNSVVEGKCDVAVLPIENSSAGEVGAVVDLMYGGPLNVNGVYTLPVSHNLLGLPGTEFDKISTVVSHPMALAQCEKYIKKYGWQLTTAESTAAAARYVSQQNNPRLAAIGSEETAKANCLEVISRNINDQRDNTTKFAVFSKQISNDIPGKKIEKFILLFTVNDKPGALVKTLSVIAEYGFNMQVLRSRPVKDKAWQYYFYTEIEGNCNSESARKMAEKLKEQCETIKIIGHFSESGVAV